MFKKKEKEEKEHRIILKKEITQHCTMKISECCCVPMEQAISDCVFRWKYNSKEKSGQIYFSDLSFMSGKYENIKFTFCPFCGRKIEMIEESEIKSEAK